MNPNHPLVRLRDELAQPAERYADPENYSRLSLVEYEGQLHVDFFGSPHEEPFGRLCELLCDEAVAGVIESLVFRSPDTGANGTCNWDLSGLAQAKARFPRLTLLSIQQNAPGDHNRKIIASDYEEEGVLGALLRKSPVLDALIAPSAPDASFFEVREHPLRYLNVDAGYDTQSFIANLAGSISFPGLRSLEWGEYNETYMKTFPEGCTRFDDYRRLFTSPAFAKVSSFTLRNPVCTADEVATLRALRPRSGLQFKLVRFSSEFVGDRAG